MSKSAFPKLRWKNTTTKWGPETYTLSRGKGYEWMAVVQKHKDGGGFYWYGGGRNTCREQPTDLATAKAAAMKHVTGKDA